MGVQRTVQCAVLCGVLRGVLRAVLCNVSCKALCDVQCAVCNVKCVAASECYFLLQFYKINPPSTAALRHPRTLGSLGLNFTTKSSKLIRCPSPNTAALHHARILGTSGLIFATSTQNESADPMLCHIRTSDPVGLEKENPRPTPVSGKIHFGPSCFVFV